MIHSGELLPGDPIFWPKTANHFRIEQRIATNGICIDIRHFGWDECQDAEFETDFYYLDYSLKPRATDARLFSGQHRKTPLGDMMFLPRGAAFKCETGASDHSVLCLTFESERALRLFQSDELTGLPPCLDLRAGTIRHAMARLLDEVRNPGFASDVLIEGVAISLVVELCRHLTDWSRGENATTGRIADWRLKRIREFIDAGLSGPLTIDGLAAECRMSPRHLIRTFKNTVGVTLSSYIADARLARAREELLRDDLQIKAVAGRCGFQSAAAFTAAFRKGTGFTPRQYREEILSRAH